MSKKTTTKSKVKTASTKKAKTVARKSTRTTTKKDNDITINNVAITANNVFSFTKINLDKANDIIKKYPKGRQKSAILPLLDLAQRQNNNWLSVAAIEYIANLVTEPYIRVYEVASFYTMFNLKPVGKYHLQVCGTTPCWLRGAAEIMKVCEQETRTKCGSTSSDGLFTISEVECLGACVNAPIVQVNDDYVEDLTTKKMATLIADMKEKAK
ncbi:MAG: NADH-quinone oxidoreductase subunit NuoE [Rickettsiaceae bacterium]|nr:NADH-quinone oxidoreductase subunit NuoE [Rickettsiaceae bacterium]